MQVVHTYKSTSEKQLVEQVAKDDEYAFTLLFYAYKDKLYSFCLRYTKSKELAEEIVQETFMKIWEGRRQLKPELCFGAYLYRITRNILFNYLKRVTIERKIKEQILYTEPKNHQQTEQSIQLADIETLLQKVIAQLPPQRQTIFRLSRIEGLSHDEIAQKMNLSPNTVKVQMSKALKFLRTYLLGHIHHIFLILKSIEQYLN